MKKAEDTCYICGRPIKKDERTELYEGYPCHSICVDDELAYEHELQEAS